MTIKELKKIKLTPMSKYEEELIKSPSEVDRHRFRNGHKDWVIDEFNMDGNDVKTTKKGLRNLKIAYLRKTFTDKEWEEILPEIYFIEFNNEFDEMAKKVIPIFDEMPHKYFEDLHSEIWQGIFSFDTHWVCAGLPIEKQICSKRNGKTYCNTLLKVYPIFKDFVDKWGYKGQYSLFRFAKKIAPNYSIGILFNENYEIKY